MMTRIWTRQGAGERPFCLLLRPQSLDKFRLNIDGSRVHLLTKCEVSSRVANSFVIVVWPSLAAGAQ
jgi:hypothetical protein